MSSSVTAAGSSSIALEWLVRCLSGEPPPWPEAPGTSMEDRIWQAGLEHGVLALCGHNLFSTPAQKTLPAGFRQRLKDYVRQAAVRELVREYEIRQVLEMLHRESLAPLLMKGTPLAYSIYPQPYLRTRCDTDLFFPDKASAEMAWQVLHDRGYQRANEVGGAFVSHEFTCHKPGNFSVKHVLDLHWKLSNNHYFAQTFGFSELQAAAVAVPKLGENARAFAPEHALLHACMHRLAHIPEGDADRLIWLYDIHLLAGSLNQKQWDGLVSLAVEKKICTICLQSFLESEADFATTIPTDVKNILQETGAKEKTNKDLGTTLLRRDLLNFRTLPGWRERLQLLKEHLFPDADYILKKYNTDKRFLLPFLYLRRAFHGVLKRIRQDP